MDNNVTELADAAADGNEDAWHRLVERYLPLVRLVAQRHGLAGPDVEDISQILWLRLVEHLRDIRGPRALPRWIATTTRNECAQLLRSTRRTAPLGASVEPLTAPHVIREVDENMLRAERHQALLQALAELPDHQRKLLVLLVADPPLSYAEISRRLGIPIGSIGPTRARALRRLREYSAVAATTGPPIELATRGEPNAYSPVSIYLQHGDESAGRAVRAALQSVLSDIGFDLISESDPVIDSFWQRFHAKTSDPQAKEALYDRIVKLERSAEVHLLTVPESQANMQNAQGLAAIIESLRGETAAVVQLGQLLVIKAPSTDGKSNIICKTLTPKELRSLERQPELLTDPCGMMARFSITEHAGEIE